ncbi:hypothetical protein PV08_04882 [Exophiala spinifera]|uniref:Xylanolytic transcriptional activator regulatory domain-containing protein n=1 Tax=Exophiala spinifera TaxID=91928 RepID=A0A0D1ZYF6_9EURO|nr:uncharacterized protein PV08_04882 [Exophiala spinifera]KIW17687.1 hypothetical protein PV08_04882 [Exophiala spinifera]
MEWNGSVDNASNSEARDSGIAASSRLLSSETSVRKPQSFPDPLPVSDPEQTLFLDSLLNPEATPDVEEVPRLGIPGYITALPSGLDLEALQFLRVRGALSIPTAEVIDELIGAYVCYIHPFMPLLDMRPFIRAVDSDGENEKISLLLFQAVMFAGATFVNEGCLSRAGYQNRNQACTSLFDRSQLLYNADIESDPTTLTQALLLMTYYHHDPGHTKGRHHLLTAACSFGTDTGLDGSPEPEVFPVAHRKLRRRLWSCCLIVDKFVSMSERRVACIHPGKSTAHTLELGDLNDTDLNDALDRYYMRDRETDARILRKLSIMNTKIYSIIDHILNTLYTPVVYSDTLTFTTKTVLVPQTSTEIAPDCMALDQELRKWYAELSTTEGSNVGRDHRRNGRVVGVHSAIVEMLYNTALILVHRPHATLRLPENSAARFLQEFSGAVTNEAARRITDIATPLQEGHLLRFLPPVGVTALFTAAREHVGDVRSGDTTTRNRGRGYFDQTKMLLIHLQSVYKSAEWAVRVIDSICTRLVNESELDAATGDGDVSESLPASPETVMTGYAAELLFAGRLGTAGLESKDIDWSVVK